MPAETTQRHPFNALHKVGHHPGRDDLAAMGHGAIAGSPVHHQPQVVPITSLGFAGMHGHANLGPHNQRPRPLQVDGREQRRGRPVENREMAVALAPGFDDHTAAGLDAGPYLLVQAT